MHPVIIREFVMKYSTNMALQAPYSLDMTTVWFFPFFPPPRLQLPVSGQNFEPTDSIKEKSVRNLNGFHKNNFKAGYDDYKKRWQKSIVDREDYFEGNALNF